EFVRLPDAHIGFIAFGWVTMGMVLTLPMLIAGLALLVWARRQPVDKTKPAVAS
ncbi:prolipoprotein diacylglyceryl transferase, partial [Halomonas sp. ND22Bw]